MASENWRASYQSTWARCHYRGQNSANTGRVGAKLMMCCTIPAAASKIPFLVLFWLNWQILPLFKRHFRLNWMQLSDTDIPNMLQEKNSESLKLCCPAKTQLVIYISALNSCSPALCSLQALAYLILVAKKNKRGLGSPPAEQWVLILAKHVIAWIKRKI